MACVGKDYYMPSLMGSLEPVGHPVTSTVLSTHASHHVRLIVHRWYCSPRSSHSKVGTIRNRCIDSSRVALQ